MRNGLKKVVIRAGGRTFKLTEKEAIELKAELDRLWPTYTNPVIPMPMLPTVVPIVIEREPPDYPWIRCEPWCTYASSDTFSLSKTS